MSPERDACPDGSRTLLLLAGELEGPEAADARAHLEACEACSTLRQELAEVERAYGSLPGVHLEPEELDAMLDRATRATPRAEPGRRVPSASRERSRRRPSPGGPDPDRRGRRRPAGRGSRLSRRLLVAAAAVGLFAWGLVTGLHLAGPGAGADGPAASTTAGTAGLGASNPIQRARFVADLRPPRLTPSVVSELVARLATEPNGAVRLAITDALHGVDMTREDQGRLLALLATEPLPSLRIELLELALDQGAPGLDTTLSRLARNDDAATVRRFASAALEGLGGRP